MNPDPTPIPNDSSAALLQRPHGCLTSVVLSVALVVVATLGGVWLITMGTMIGLASPNAHLWVGGAYALALIAVFGGAALLLRTEQFGLWRGVALGLALAGGLAGIHSLLMVFHHPFPDWLGPLQPALTLLYALAAAVLMRRHLFGRPARGVIAIGAGLALLVSAPWVVVGALGTPNQTLLGLFSGLAYGVACAVIVASIFFYDHQMPARQPFWSAAVAGIVFIAIEPGLLAGRGFLLQSVYLFLATGMSGLIGGALFAFDEARDVRRTWWGLLAFYVVLCAVPFTWSSGFEGEWMIEDMLVAWFPALMVELLVGGLLAVLALILQRWLARLAPNQPFSAGLGLGALALTAALFVGFGQPEVMPNTFFVIMAAQADTLQYATIADRNNRMQGVYRALVDQANKSQADLRAFLDQRGVHYTPYYLVSGLEVQGSPLLRAQIAARPDVATILNSPHARPLPASAKPINMIPPEPHPAGQDSWGVDKIGAPQAWQMGYTGQGIIVGSADSGVDWTHPALRSQYLGKDGDHNYTWFDPWYYTSEPTDTGGHGTHTMGIILGQDGIGVAPGAQWIACRNLARNLGNPAYYLDCMQFLFAPFPLDGNSFTDGDPARGADVTNNSWGCPPQEGCDDHTFAVAVQHLRDAGQMTVVSAGNEGPACSTISPPASADAAFSVGAIGSQGALIADFSSRGPVSYDGQTFVKPDIAAPGVGILSSTPGGRYGTASGTSMAGPHVVGLVALLWSADPALIGNVDVTEQIIENTAQHVPSNACGAASGDQNDVYGFGIPNAVEAIRQALQK